MVLKYKEKAVAGTEYRRTKEVRIKNTLDVVPIIYFIEEIVTNIAANKNIFQEVDQLAVSYDATASIPLLDPSTDLPTGSNVTHEYLYQIIYSLYMQAATARDNL